MKNQTSKAEKTARLYAKLMETVVCKNMTESNSYFLSYSGHCGCFDISIYRNGWDQDKRAEFYKSFFLVKDSDILEAIKIIENFNKTTKVAV